MPAELPMIRRVVCEIDKQGKSVERRVVTVIFENDKLARVEGDVKGFANAADADVRPAVTAPRSIDGGGIEGKSVDPPPPPPKGFFGRMLEKMGL